MDSAKGYFWALVVVAALTPPAAGQLELRGLREPRLRNVTTPGGNLTTQPPGLGGLSAPSPAGSDLLRSSIYSSGAYDLSRRAGGQAPSAAGGLSSPSPRGMSLEPLQVKLAPPTGSPGTPVAPADQAAGVDVTPYLAAMNYTGSLTAGSDEPITTFVPTESSIYQVNMERGDKAFRTRRYAEALGHFQVANVIAHQAPEGELSIVHAMFAAEQYYGAVGHLNRALRLLPELPLVHLRLRGFYGNLSDFVGQQDRLRQRALAPMADPELLVLLAYVRYVDDAPGDAANLLRQAYERAKVPELRESIEIFWDGMVAGGAVAGGLTSTQPASAPAKVGVPTIPVLPSPPTETNANGAATQPATPPALEPPAPAKTGPGVVDPELRQGRNN